MDVNVKNTDWFDRALKPGSQRKDWKNLRSYIYVISREFPPYNDHTNKALTRKMHLVKIGFSSILSDSGSNKGLHRVYGLRTALVSLKLHRIYLYSIYNYKDGKRNTDAKSAFKAEQMIHDVIEEDFEPKPAIFRIKFRNDTDTEWFHIRKEHMQRFLEFLDDNLFNTISPHCVYGTEFFKNKSRPLEIEVEPQYVGVMYDKETKSLKNRDTLRKVAKDMQENARSLRKRQKDAEIIRRNIDKKEQVMKDRKKYAKNEEFWQKVFMPGDDGLEFTTKKKMWFGDTTWERFPDKKIDGVFYDSGERQVIIWYEINPKSLIGRGGRVRKISESVKDNAEGYLTVNEALDEFPKLLSKYRANYNWYKDYNHYIDDIDYEELGG